MTPAELTHGLKFATASLRERVSWIMEMVSESFEIPTAALLESSKVSRLAVPRQVAMSLIREHSFLTLVDIGELFHRHHSTVIHAIQAVRDRREVSAPFDHRIAEISRQVRHRFSV